MKDTYNFGPILIKDGRAQPAWSETAKYYPRTAVGMVKPGIYVLLVTDTGSYAGLNHWILLISSIAMVVSTPTTWMAAAPPHCITMVRS